MGVYYIIVNHAKKQFMEPGDIEDGPVKLPSIAASKTTNILYLALTWMGDWDGDSITFLGDGGDDYFDIQDQYEDVTKKFVEDYNESFASWTEGHIKYTGSK